VSDAVATPGLLRRLFKPVLTIAMFAIMILGVRRLLGSFELAEVTAGMAEMPVGSILVAIGVLATQHALYVVRETLAVGFAGHDDLGTRKIAVASLVARSLSTLGLATITGFALRLRLYEAWGLEKRDVATLTLYNEVTYYVGLTVTLGAAFLIADVPTMVAAGLTLPSPTVIGVVATGLAAAYVVLSLRRTEPWRFRSYQVPAVRGRLLAGQVVLPLVDAALGAVIVWVCLPASAGLDLPETIAVCQLAGIAGSISQVPGGLGVFETVLLQFVPTSVHATALAALLVRRVIVNLVPLAAGTLVLVGFEVTTRPGAAVPLGWRRQTMATALAVTAFASGVLLLVAASLGLEGPFGALGVAGQWLLFADGFGTLLVARGLHLRSVQSWRAAVGLFALRAVVAVLAGPSWFSLGLAAAMVGLLAAGHRAFPERDLRRDDDTAWAVAFTITIAGVAWLALVTDPMPERVSRVAIARGAGIITAFALVAAVAVERWRRHRKNVRLEKARLERSTPPT